MYITGSQGDEEIAGAQDIAYLVVSQGEVRQELRIHRPILLYGIHDSLTADSGNGRLTGRVDICYIELIHVLQYPTEVIAQQLGARVAVRLEQYNQSLRFQALGSLQSCRNFGGVVTIVIHDAVVTGQVLGFKASASTGETYQSARDAGEVAAQFQRQSCSRQRVQHIVATGDTQLHASECGSFVVDGVEGTSALDGHIRCGVICILPAVGDCIGILGTDVSGSGIALAVDELTAGLAAQAVEHALDVVEIAIEIKMFCLYIQDDAVLRNIVYEGAITFIAFGYQIF